MTRFLLTALLLGSCALASAQSAPLPSDTTAFFADLRARTERAIAAAPAAHRDFFAEAYEERADDIRREVLDSLYLFDEQLDGFIARVFNEVASKNELGGDHLLLVRRSQRPNAFSMGDGIFALHLGILQQITTEAELAFVIAHELAHDALAHQRSSLTQMALATPDLERKARRLTRRGLFAAGSVRKERLAEDLRTTIYGRFARNREKELQADSLALVFIGKTKYRQEVAARAIQQLEDKDFFELADLDLAGVLGTAAYPFKEKWIRIPEDAMFGGSFGGGADDEVDVESFWTADSMSTHPALDERQSVLAGLVAIDTTTATDPHGYREYAIREALAYQLEQESTGHALLNALVLHHQFPNDPRYEAHIGEALLATHRAITEYTFDEAVPPITYFRSLAAQSTIRLLRQIRKSELQKLTLAYLTERAAARPESAELAAALAEATAYFTSQD